MHYRNRAGIVPALLQEMAMAKKPNTPELLRKWVNLKLNYQQRLHDIEVNQKTIQRLREDSSRLYANLDTLEKQLTTLLMQGQSSRTFKLTNSNVIVLITEDSNYEGKTDDDRRYIFQLVDPKDASMETI